LSIVCRSSGVSHFCIVRCAFSQAGSAGLALQLRRQIASPGPTL
jgi:hypothetical protein